jgi:predicted TIM-barrel fold metal-dependent hydrolase
MTEHGISWIPMVLWKLDSRYAMLRRESPWVKRLPSEYIMKHVWFSTQPIDAPDRRGGGLVQMLRSYDGIEDRLCFATDYPHWDADEPNQVAAILPASWQEKICYGNARQFFGDRLAVNGASVSRPRSREEQQDAG